MTTTNSPTIAVLQGPNLHLLGTREPEIYGSTTLDELHRSLTEYAAGLGFALVAEQHNAESGLIDALTRLRAQAAFVILNAGAYTHYSYALRDAITGTQLRVIEVHISNTAARESFRHQSVIAPVCAGVIAGFGLHSYFLAVDAVRRLCE